MNALDHKRQEVERQNNSPSPNTGETAASHTVHGPLSVATLTMRLACLRVPLRNPTTRYPSTKRTAGRGDEALRHLHDRVADVDSEGTLDWEVAKG